MLEPRESKFWPGISNDIWEAVEKCGICQSTSRAAKPVGNISEVSPHAWHTVGSDLFYCNKMDYLVVSGYFSKYLTVRKIPNTSTHLVIKELGMIFTEFRCPFVLKSDNGPCYTSREFHNFLKFYKVHHITSSPHYPQSNGFTEALVGISKEINGQPFYFELEAEGKEWNNKGHIPPCSHHPFNSNLSVPEIPALPMDSLIPPALTSKAAPPVQGHIPVSSSSVTQPSITSGDPLEIPSTPR